MRREHNKEDQFDPEEAEKQQYSLNAEEQKSSSSRNSRSIKGRQQHCQERTGGAISRKSRCAMGHDRATQKRLPDHMRAAVIRIGENYGSKFCLELIKFLGQRIAVIQY
ncbi:hypothetical protein TNCV_2077911 [Trichonephila clavipes]|nr:hypothetical protein TNCV_2077911 [Trichonephila clavipes]